MAWTESDRDALKAALAKGERSVSFGDRAVVYRSVSEMVEVLRLMDAELDAAATTPRPKQWLGYGSKGT